MDSVITGPDCSVGVRSSKASNLLCGLFQAACREYKKPGKKYEETVTSSWPQRPKKNTEGVKSGPQRPKERMEKMEKYNKSHQLVVKTKLHEPVEEFGDEISSACRLRSMLVRLRYKQNFSR